MAGIWPLLRKQSVGSVLSQLVNVAGDAYCTMTFLFACVWLNPLDHFLFPAFVHDPMAIMRVWLLFLPSGGRPFCNLIATVCRLGLQ